MRSGDCSGLGSFRAGRGSLELGSFGKGRTGTIGSGFVREWSEMVGIGGVGFAWGGGGLLGPFLSGLGF